MSPTERTWLAVGAVAAVVSGPLLTPAPALADPTADTQTEDQPAEAEVLHNIVYRARIDGVSRGATITYTAQGNQIQSADPTMVPGRVFEVNTVLPESSSARMRVAIEWPYSANLHCEILIDDQLAAQADDFIGPTVLPQRDDPDYGALVCEAPVDGVPNALPLDPHAPPTAEDGPPPVDPPPAT
ncbi:hypothetical protein [Mycolicibacterium elephantis]|uniref:Uncharacterized protein n=1 Tax=Mycolicibacterium elephantis DSM 44368 TaxID=1335622 RepID=A0A439DPM3_9MYCO|nr:hypothetical protein [Mycolicibacterium elephantis]MCV7219828.1 hypothetical protein [Mycolicibacterium elephantis]RWA17567.1 hypothetical protein MELE44368_05320 [Mycolicibacterium elephantis DSM 44368]